MNDDPTGAKWLATDRLFQRALDRPPADRLEFVRREAGEDEVLRRSVESLLTAAGDSEAFLETPAEAALGIDLESLLQSDELGSETPRDPIPDRSGERVGPYRLIERIGAGGMATVYLAERVDGQWSQLVAVKVIRRGLDTEDIVRRFIAERQILSSLQHPNIARLLDGGSTEEGLPFLVMEIVDGVPISAHCDDQRLSIEARLRLFVEVCRAVAHAHGNLVVHRDIKPSNILVTKQGVPKLLDFGIAKLLDDPDEGGSKTRTGHQLLTPQYASPEQVRGEPITTASDVYQLGILLCRLLSGHRPYDVSALSPAQAELKITESVPEPPSRLADQATAEAFGTTLDRLTRRLGGDLDTIVLTAIRKQPVNRYSSVEALANDIERYLAGLPIAARPATRRYRVMKWMARHRAGAAAAVAGVLMLVGWAVTATIQSSALARERDRVADEAARTGAIRDYLVGMFELSDPSQPDPLAGDSTSARELLDEGARRLATDFADRPLLHAELAYTIGRTYRALSLDQQSRELLEEALALQLDTRGPEAPETARTLFELGQLYEAINADSAAALLERALLVSEAAFGDSDPRVAEVLTALGRQLVFTATPDTVRSRALVERAVTILRADPNPPRAQLADALAVSVYGLENIDLDLTVDRMTEALSIRRELFGDQHPAVAASLSDLSLALERTQPERADSMMEAALGILEVTLGESHRQTLAVMGNLAAHYRDIREDYVASEALYLRRIALSTTHRPNDRLAEAYPRYGLAGTLMRMGRFDEAEPQLRRTHELLVAEVGWGNGLSFTTRGTLGACLRELGRLAEAAAILEESRAGFDDALSLSVGNKRGTLRELRLVYEAQGRTDAVSEVDSAIARLEAS